MPDPCPPDDFCTYLLVPPPKDKSLGADRADQDPDIFLVSGKGEKGLLIDIGSNENPVFYDINAEKRFMNANPFRNGFRALFRRRDVKGVGQHHFLDEPGNFLFCPFFA